MPRAFQFEKEITVSIHDLAKKSAQVKVNSLEQMLIKVIAPFAKLPYGTQQSLFDKMHFSCVARLYQTHSFVEKWSQKTGNCKTLGVYAVEITEDHWSIEEPGGRTYQKICWRQAKDCNFRVSAKIIHILVSLSDELVDNLITVMEGGWLETIRLNLNEIVCSPKKLGKLLKLSKASCLYIDFGSQNILQIDEILEMKILRVCGPQIFDPALFLKMKATHIDLEAPRLLAHIIAKYIEQCRLNKRNVNYLSLIFSEKTVTQLIELLPDIGVNVIWTPENHSDSFINMLDIDALHFSRTRFYSVEQISTGFRYLLDIEGDNLRFGPMNSTERNVILSRLPSFQRREVEKNEEEAWAEEIINLMDQLDQIDLGNIDWDDDSTDEYFDML